MKKEPLSYIEISKENLIHNIKQFRDFVKEDTLIAAVIKANAYGHGDREVVKILNPYVDYFQINSIEELESIRRFTKKPILLLGYVGKDDIGKVIALNAIISIFDLEHALLVNTVASSLGKKIKVHIAVDSYLGREGIMPDQVERIMAEVKNMKSLIIDGVYSHFANIEDVSPKTSDKSVNEEDFTHAQKQIDSYKETCNIFHQLGFSHVKTHISATSGVFIYEKGKGINDIVRIGIGLYGIWPSTYLNDAFNKKFKINPIIRWVTHIAQVKTLPKGHSIGYGLSYITKSQMTVAVIPQGYSNGYDRKLSNKGEVLVRGKRAKVLGRIAMNMFVVDVSNIEDVQTGDEVVLLGSQGNDSITAEELASKIDTVNYEVVTRISPLLPRIIR